ncbi:P2X purinoceptor 4 [Pelomyxa schiedti]|nr:P2X purinoceptor 4 [Pelomyxa schiedti]
MTAASSQRNSTANDANYGPVACTTTSSTSSRTSSSDGPRDGGSGWETDYGINCDSGDEYGTGRVIVVVLGNGASPSLTRCTTALKSIALTLKEYGVECRCIGLTPAEWDMALSYLRGNTNGALDFDGCIVDTPAQWLAAISIAPSFVTICKHSVVSSSPYSHFTQCPFHPLSNVVTATHDTIRHHPTTSATHARSWLSPSKFIITIATVFRMGQPWAHQCLYGPLGIKCMKKYMQGREKSQFCFLDIRVSEQRTGTVVLELFSKVCPLTCSNFMVLCRSLLDTTTLSYKNTIFHRVNDAWIQGGDTSGGYGNSSTATYATGNFRDENYAIKHDVPGILGMANTGQRHTNGSQFYITLAPLPSLDKHCVAFGRVFNGWGIIQEISSLPTNTYSQRPINPPVIINCGAIPIRHPKKKNPRS